MPAISVLLPTYRPGGVEMAVRSLGCQTFRDFEVVIADEHWRARTGIWGTLLKKEAKLSDRQIKFADMSRSLFPRSSAPIAHNEMIKKASGELCIFFSDYAMAQPDWLQNHWNIWKTGTPCMGPFEFVMPSKEMLHVPTPIHVDSQWMADHGAEYSIFKDSVFDFWNLPVQTSTLNNETGVWSEATSGQDLKLEMHEGPCDWTYYYNKNEAVPLEALLRINGADEQFNGLHPFDDHALALRLTAAGVRWRVSQSVKIRIVQVRHFMDFTKWDKPVADAAALFEGIRSYVQGTGDYRTPNPFDLRTEWRKEHR